MTPSAHDERATKDPADRNTEQAMGTLLRAGVVLAAVVVLGGAVAYVPSHDAMPAGHRIFHGEPGTLRTPARIVADAWAGDSLGVMQLGLLLLIATPVARVAFAVVAFARQHDRLYVAFTLIVLAILLYSLVAES